MIEQLSTRLETLRADVARDLEQAGATADALKERLAAARTAADHARADLRSAWLAHPTEGPSAAERAAAERAAAAAAELEDAADVAHQRVADLANRAAILDQLLDHVRTIERNRARLEAIRAHAARIQGLLADLDAAFGDYLAAAAELDPERLASVQPLVRRVSAVATDHDILRCFFANYPHLRDILRVERGVYQVETFSDFVAMIESNTKAFIDPAETEIREALEAPAAEKEAA